MSNIDWPSGKILGNQNCVREAHGYFLVLHYNKRARSLTLISTPGTSFLPLSPPPPIPSSSLQFHLLLHTRPILSISSLFFQSSSSSSNPRNKTFRNVMNNSPPDPLRSVLFGLFAWSPLFMSVHHVSSPSHFHSLLWFARSAPSQSKCCFNFPQPTTSDLAHTHIIDHQSGQNLHLRIALAVALQLIVLWEIGYRSWIQRMK